MILGPPYDDGSLRERVAQIPTSLGVVVPGQGFAYANAALAHRVEIGQARHFNVTVSLGETTDILSGRMRDESTAGTGRFAGGRGGPSSLHLDRFEVLVCQEPASDDRRTATNNQPAANHDFATTDDRTCSDNDDYHSAISPGPLSNWVVLRE